MSYDQDLLIRAAACAPSPDNAQHWTFDISGRSVRVCHRAGSAVDPFGPTGHATLIGVGAMLENVVQASLAIDRPVPICDVPDSAISPSQDYFQFQISGEDWRAHADLPLFQRHTNRFGYTKPHLPDDLLEPTALNQQGRVRLVTVNDANGFDALGAIANTCCQARFCDRELHEWLMSSIRFDATEVASGDGIDIASVDLPPGGGQFMRFIRPWSRMARLNRFRAYKLMALQEVTKMRNASALLCLIGEATPVGARDAGQLMERAWIALNAAGWAVHPYYVVADQQSRFDDGRVSPAWREPVGQALARLNGYFQLDAGERLHMMLRVGWPKKPNPVKSRRLPLADLIRAE